MRSIVNYAQLFGAYLQAHPLIINNPKLDCVDRESAKPVFAVGRLT